MRGEGGFTVALIWEEEKVEMSLDLRGPALVVMMPSCWCLIWGDLVKDLEVHFAEIHLRSGSCTL